MQFMKTKTIKLQNIFKKFVIIDIIICLYNNQKKINFFVLFMQKFFFNIKYNI